MTTGTEDLPGGVTNEDEVGFWSKDTESLIEIEDPQDFRSFFTAYENFKSIRDSDVSLHGCCGCANGCP